MSIKDNLDEAQKKVKELQDQLKDLTLESSAIIDISNLTKANSAINTLTKAVTAAKKEASDLEKGFGGIAASIGASLAEMNKQSSATNRTVKAMRGLSSISESLKHDQLDLYKLSLKELESKRDKTKILSEEAKSQAALVKQKYDEITLDKNGNQLQGAALNAKLKSLGISKSELQTMNEIVAAHEAQFPVLDELNAKIKERIEEEKKVNKTLGLTKVVLEGLGKIPIVGPLLDVNTALDAAREKAEAGGNAWASLAAAAGSMGKSLVSNLTDPLVIVGLLVKGFQMFMDIGFSVSKQSVQLQKSMASSEEQATATRNRFVEIQNSNESIFETTESLIAAQMELAGAMGVTSGFTDQQVRDQVMLTKEMGFSAEAADGIQKLAMANGMTAEDVTNSVIKQTSALAKQTGIQLDNKAVIEDVAKVSGQLRLQYANNPKLIAKAVVETKKLGINMEIAANAAKGLLDFESSIENELSAELLTGKALNLERARGLALNGDSVGAAKEMLAQVGSAADFANMNAIQQEAIAKAVGMSTDDLANSLVTQENMSKLGDETRKRVEEEIEAAKALGDMDKVRMLEASIGNEKDAQAALKKNDAQTLFTQSIEKLKAMLTSIVEGPAKKFIDYLTGSTNGVSNMQIVFTQIKDTIFGIVTWVKKWSDTIVFIAKIMGIIKAGQIAYNIASALGLGVEKMKTKETKKQGLIAATAAAFKVGGSLGPAALVAIPAMIAAGIAAFAMFNKGGSVPGTNTKSDSVPAMLTSGEYVIPNSNGKTGTEKYNEMISPETPAMLNGGGKVSINPNKGNLTPSTSSDNRGNNQDLTSLIPAINSLQNNIKSLIQIHVDFLKELKLILTPTTKIPTKETTLTKETSLKKEVTPLDLLNVLNPFSSMLKVGSLLLNKSIETKNNLIKPIENNSIKSKQTNIDQNVVKPIENNKTPSKQNNIDQNVNKSPTFSSFNSQNNTSKSDTGVIQAINGLRSDLKALASRPIHTSVQLDGKELATMQGKYPNEAGDANGKVAYKMS